MSNPVVLSTTRIFLLAHCGRHILLQKPKQDPASPWDLPFEPLPVVVNIQDTVDHLLNELNLSGYAQMCHGGFNSSGELQLVYSVAVRSLSVVKSSTTHIRQFFNLDQLPGDLSLRSSDLITECTRLWPGTMMVGRSTRLAGCSRYVAFGRIVKASPTSYVLSAIKSVTMSDERNKVDCWGAYERKVPSEENDPAWGRYVARPARGHRLELESKHYLWSVYDPTEAYFDHFDNTD